MSPTYSIIFTKFPLLEEKLKSQSIAQNKAKAHSKQRSPADPAVSVFSIRSDAPPHYSLSEHLRMVFIELSRFKPPGGDINKLLDKQSQWCYLIKESGRLTHEKAKLLARKGEDMGLALKFLYELSADHRRQAEQEAIEKYERDQRGIKQFEYNKGMEKGIEKGKAEGMQEGMEKGQQQLILKLLERGMDLQSICKYTGFSEDAIKKLKNGAN